MSHRVEYKRRCLHAYTIRGPSRAMYTTGTRVRVVKDTNRNGFAKSLRDFKTISGFNGVNSLVVMYKKFIYIWYNTMASFLSKCVFCDFLKSWISRPITPSPFPPPSTGQRRSSPDRAVHRVGNPTHRSVHIHP